MTSEFENPLVWIDEGAVAEGIQSTAAEPHREFGQLYNCDDTARYLANSHVFFAKKVRTSNHLARFLANVLASRGLVYSVEQHRLHNFHTSEPLASQAELPVILLIESYASDENLNKIVENALDYCEGKKAIVWLVSFLSLIDRRVLARFNSFFAFASSSSELDILSDVLPIPRRTLEALNRAHDKLFFFTEGAIKAANSEIYPNPCFVRLPAELQTGITRWPSIDVRRLYRNLPSGPLSRYYARDHVPLLEYQLSNYTMESHTVRLSCKLEGEAFERSETVTILPGQTKIYRQSPFPEKYGEGTSGTGVTTVQVEIVCFLDGQQSDPDRRTIAINKLPWNALRLAVPKDTSGEDFIELQHHVAAFVTPEAQAVVDIFDKVKHISGNFNWPSNARYRDVGELLTKIRAIYDTLQHHPWEPQDLVYIEGGQGNVTDDLPIVYGPTKDELWGYQRVRLPSETLSDRCGNCLDFTLLFASILERAHIPPLVVLEQNHAFVGWKVRFADKDKKEEKEFLETTCITRKEIDFDEALGSGRRRYELNEARGWFRSKVYDKDGFARLVDIDDTRRGEKPIYPLVPEPR